MPEIGNNIAKADIDMIDESFDISQSENYNLFIQIGCNRLSFCVHNNKFNVLRSYPLYQSSIISECRTIFERDDLLGLRYKDSRHLWISPRCTLVPEHLFDSRDTDLYLTFNHGKTTGEQASHNYIRSANLYNVFSCPVALTALLQLFQPNIKLFHHATPLIELGVADNNANVAVYSYSDYLDIMVIEKNKLLFYNTFQINAPEDSVYYYSLVTNSLNVKHFSTKLIYAEDCNKIAILKDYADNVVEYELPIQRLYEIVSNF